MNSDHKIIVQSAIPDHDRISLSANEFEAGQQHDVAYWNMLHKTVELMMTFSLKAKTICEFGAGTGLFSQLYVPIFPEAEVVITEPDDHLLHEIPEKLANFPRVQYVQALAQSFRWSNPFDLITGTEAYHHVPDTAKQNLFQNFSRLLVPDGFVIIGDNFLPSYNANDPKDKLRALHTFWDPYIAQKKSAGDEGGVRSFTYALEQAERGVMEYKTSLEVFEQYAHDTGFRVVSKTMLSEGIQQHGGYCVFVLTSGTKRA